MMKSSGEAGMTLVEVAVASAIFGLVIGMVFWVVLSGQRQVEADSPQAEIENMARRIVDEIAGELRKAGLSTLTPPTPVDSSSISFQLVSGYDPDTGALTYDPEVIQFRFQPSSADPVNGVDDDGDGVVDDGTLVREVTGKLPVILTPWAANGDFKVTLQGSALQISLRLRRSLKADEVITAERSTSVTLRN